MNPLYLIPFSFILGISLGSFLNVIIDRLATKRSFVKGRSYCESCKRTIPTKDLIPLVSFILLRGKCRYCKAKIPPRLFFVELIIGIIFVYLFITFFQNPLLLTILCVITLVLTAIFFIDLEYGIIPDSLTFIFTLLSAVYALTIGNFFSNLFSGIVALFFFLALFLITRGRGMGFGDVKLSFSIGLLLGFPLFIYGLYLAFLTGAIVSIILVIWKKKSFRKGTVPFGPFLVSATLLTLFFAEQVIFPLANLIF